MLVNENGVFVTQREASQMALIHPDIPTPDGIMLRAVKSAANANTGVQEEPLFVKRIGEDQSTPTPVEIWDDSVPGVDQGDAAAAWFQAVLGKPGIRLMLIADSAHRATDTKFAVGETGFADGFPILVTSQASVEDLNQRVQSLDISINRLRPNLHIGGCGAFEEDEMRSLTFTSSPMGSFSSCLRLVKPCARCTVPIVDPSSGERAGSNGEPLKTLRRYRSGSQLRHGAQLHKTHFANPENSEEAFFGQNAAVEFAPGAVLQVGDIASVEW